MRSHKKGLTVCVSKVCNYAIVFDKEEKNNLRYDIYEDNHDLGYLVCFYRSLEDFDDRVFLVIINSCVRDFQRVILALPLVPLSIVFLLESIYVKLRKRESEFDY